MIDCDKSVTWTDVSQHQARAFHCIRATLFVTLPGFFSPQYTVTKYRQFGLYRERKQVWDLTPYTRPLVALAIIATVVMISRIGAGGGAGTVTRHPKCPLSPQEQLGGGIAGIVISIALLLLLKRCCRCCCKSLCCCKKKIATPKAPTSSPTAGVTTLANETADRADRAAALDNTTTIQPTITTTPRPVAIGPALTSGNDNSRTSSFQHDHISRRCKNKPAPSSSRF